MKMDNSTSIIPAFLVGWVQLLVPQPCFDKFFIEFELLNVPCLKVVVSKGLGYAIIAGSLIVKVPQIIKILRARSGAGINMYAVTCEVVAISASWCYGSAQKFPFSSYGEAVFLAFQSVTIAMLVLLYSNKTLTALVYVMLYVASMFYLLSPAAPMSVLSALQGSNAGIVAVSKLIQAFENYKNGGTGQLSAVTVFLLFLGSIARIFTSIQETGDSLVVFTYIISTAFNGLIAAQIVYYWNVKPKQKKQ